MARGTPGVKRTRTISVRVSQAEWEAWEARRARSGRVEMGAWVRAVVTDADVDVDVDADAAQDVGEDVDLAVGAEVDGEAAGEPHSPDESSVEPSAGSSSQASSRQPVPRRAARRAAGDRPVVPEVNERAYAALIRASNNLNQLTRFSHQIQALAPGIETAMAEVVEASRAVRGVVVISSPRSVLRPQAVASATSRRRPARAGGPAGDGAAS